MNSDPFRHAFWCLRLVVFAAWATLVLVWRRGCYIGFPTLSELKYDEWQFMGLLVLLPVWSFCSVRHRSCTSRGSSWHSLGAAASQSLCALLKSASSLLAASSRAAPA
jgi:hypothetical protein